MPDGKYRHPIHPDSSKVGTRWRGAFIELCLDHRYNSRQAKAIGKTSRTR